MNNQTLCLCGSDIEYQQCCGPFHSGETIPVTAEALMRSRYSAYVLRNGVYLQETWEVTRRPKAIDFSRENIAWLRLEITDIKKGGIKDNKGVVTFKAFYIQDNQEHVMTEISRFTRTNGRWFYLDGVIKSMSKVDQQTNQGKNAPCSCGSGKKFKRCCGVG
ncbi:YchJ family protein [Methylobacter sp. S3L5C]|uniref:YchJ family protein n=1 Tax=Methylobacter sp. S3L5C TaxID=2839024 RepID=UPI001FABC34D|nr:YchJ family protein [Methylobacter sp. S3L5C]UOA09983.1 YchJ family protein [Methylobacter sp. S3L5C]